MKKALFVIPAILLGLATGQAAIAQTSTTPAAPRGEMSPQMQNLPSTRTRAEVQAECNEALKAGRTPTGECSAGPSGTSTKTRAQVKAECEKSLEASGRKPSGECGN